VAGRSGNGTVTISFSGPGDAIEETDIAGHGYTFVAINQTTNAVTAQSTMADFTALSSGSTYNVYGVSYNNSETPSSWVGLSQSVLVDGTRCLTLSDNATTLTVNVPPCSNPTPSIGTTINSTNCSNPNGSIQLSGLVASTAHTLNYKKDGVAATVVNFTSDASGNYLLSNLGAGSYTEISISSPTCTSANLMTTLTEPSGSQSFLIILRVHLFLLVLLLILLILSFP